MKEPRILIVDDDKIVRTAVSGILSNHGYSVVAANTAEAALESCAIGHFDLAILDYKIPNMSGLALAEILTSVYDIPFLFLTVVDDQAVVRQAISHGVQSYLVKPVEAPELVAQVEVSLTRAAETKHLSRAVAETQLINVAVGLLMATRTLARKEAFEALLAICRPKQMKAVEVAESVVANFEAHVEKMHTFEQSGTASGNNE